MTNVRSKNSKRRCVMDRFPKYPRRNYRDSNLFVILRAYLLYKTGETLTPNAISNDIKKIFADDGFKPSDDTINKFLSAMISEGELICLSREYVKPQYTKSANSKDVSLSFGQVYYLTYQRELLEEIYNSECFIKISLFKNSRGTRPGFDGIYKKTLVCQRLMVYDTNVKSGEIVYHYNDEGKDNKITISADFLVNENGIKTVYIFSGMRSMFKWENDRRGEHVLNAILSIQRFAKRPVKIITLWDDEPKSPNIKYIKEVLESKNCDIIPWYEV